MSSVAIVAIPEENDYVWKISSEKIPHLTLLFLGEAGEVKNLDKIIDFVKHTSNTTASRFGLEVDRRGDLGEENADVLFFSKNKWSGYETVRNFRSNLLKDSNIKTAYDSVEQFPEWIPHLTLGYPATPAKPDNRDYPGINYVNFDRIAVWFGDYEGVEFPLKRYEGEVVAAMSSVGSKVVEDVLSHYGVKGMKWGHRKASDSATVQRRAAEKMDKQDAKFIKKTRGNTTRYPFLSKANTQVMNASSKSMKSDVKALKKRPEYNTREAKYQIKKNKNNYDPDPNTYPIAAKYQKDISNIYMKHVRQNAPKFMGASASGRLEHKLEIGKNYWTISVVETKTAKHADSSSFSVKVRPVFDEDGYIIDIEVINDTLAQSAIDHVLSHYGVKGMKWGVRRERPSAVTVTDRRKKLKTSGGFNHPAHLDAVKARQLQQVGKKSGLKALSNEELRVYANRLQLEQNVKRLNYQDKNVGQRFVATLLGKSGNSLASEGVNKGSKEVGKRALRLAALAA